MDDDEIRRLAKAKRQSWQQGFDADAERQQERLREAQQREADRIAELADVYRKCSELGDKFRRWARRERFGTNWSENVLKSGWVINSRTYEREWTDAVSYGHTNGGSLTNVLVLLRGGGIYSSQSGQMVAPGFLFWPSTLDQLWPGTYEEMTSRVISYVAQSRRGASSWR